MQYRNITTMQIKLLYQHISLLDLTFSKTLEVSCDGSFKPIDKTQIAVVQTVNLTVSHGKNSFILLALHL